MGIFTETKSNSNNIRLTAMPPEKSGFAFQQQLPRGVNKKGFLKSFSKLKEKHLRLSLFF